MIFRKLIIHDYFDETNTGNQNCKPDMEDIIKLTVGLRFDEEESVKIKAAKIEFQVRMEQSWFRPSQNPYSLYQVKKKQPGEWRPYGEYRRFNSVTVPKDTIVDCLSSSP
ncbi:hypothetical protein Zmor_007852 [Zophobas morio]|uniref:Uncharacterized protein n=1 Tax=Zophobas morio TaxID=2755281 RepID=A0AA38MJ08_9CUCU|nr:hypothetical protein Zmor_009822 [Zophobas morio]KAJ3663605.1 hypothetical protein Zmor_007852 [Zophobas morio]